MSGRGAMFVLSQKYREMEQWVLWDSPCEQMKRGQAVSNCHVYRSKCCWQALEERYCQTQNTCENSTSVFECTANKVETVLKS